MRSSQLASMPLYLRARNLSLQQPAASTAPQARSTALAPLPSEAPARQLRPGQHLCWSGDPVRELWVVQHGSLKAYELSVSGEERVCAFFFAKEIVGWEALACGSFRISICALEPTLVTPLVATALLDTALSSAHQQGLLLDGLRSEFLRLRSRIDNHYRSAGARLASFLLWIADTQAGEENGRPLKLAMSRKDIGSYLGLATETVSRGLSAFDRAGWIKLHRRSLWIRDVRRLRGSIEAESESDPSEQSC